jgi:hypothetical protein
MRCNFYVYACGLVAMLVLAPAFGRPVLYPRSTTVMLEYCDDVMQEVQLLYSPSARWSIGAGHLELEDTGPNHEHQVNFARLNLLLKRWNLESAQANVFVWGGVGRSSVSIAPSPAVDPDEHNHGAPAEPGQPQSFEETAYNSGAQVDYETRRLYFAASSDAHYSSTFLHRTDRLQLGVAPYKHEAGRLATWVVLSASHYAGDIDENTQVALLLRFFRKHTWMEVGATTDGKPQARFMLTF